MNEKWYLLTNLNGSVWKTKDIRKRVTGGL